MFMLFIVVVLNVYKKMMVIRNIEFIVKLIIWEMWFDFFKIKINLYWMFIMYRFYRSC